MPDKSIITITNSIFRAFLECPARAMAEHGKRVTSGRVEQAWVGESSKNMAAGSLVDAIITRGFRPAISDTRIMPVHFSAYLKSSYDDGMKNAMLLCNKSGGWNADAAKAINAANKLMLDPIAQKIMSESMMQPRISFMITDDVRWEGDIDMLHCKGNSRFSVIDLKSPSKTDDGWIASMGKNVKVPWYDAWSYWFQIGGYIYGLKNAGKCDTRLNGHPISECIARDFPNALEANVEPFIEGQIIFASREEYPDIGLVNIADMSSTWYSILTAKSRFWNVSKLDTVKSIINGEVEAVGCGKCDYCKSKKQIVVADSIPDMPIIDDSYGYGDLVIE